MDSYLARRAAFLASATPGSEAARQLSRIADEAVGALALAASSSAGGRWAVVALGGWGRGELLPDSDLDLLILVESSTKDVVSFVERVLYPLWDSGLRVGHQVRTPKQQERAMHEDLSCCTAGLTARPVAGEMAWAQTQIQRWRLHAARRARRYRSELAVRPRPGSPFRLDAHLKEGAGGRRDVDEMVWLSMLAAPDAPDADAALTRATLLSPTQLETLRDAAETLCSTRWTLQREGHGDRMTPEGAEALGAPAAEHVHRALGDVAFLLEGVRERTTASVSSARQHLDASALFALLDGDEADLGRVEREAHSGALENALPGLAALMWCRRPGMGHELTVGAHCLKAAWLVGRVGSDPTLRASLAATDRRLVQVAALTHDAGKREAGPGHAARGRSFAINAATELGLSEKHAQAAGRLVALHLLLAETAFARDLEDPGTITTCAQQIGDRDLVPALHALTAVDSMATGPHTWTPWAATLVAQLVSRVDALLGSGEPETPSHTADVNEIMTHLSSRVPGEFASRFLAEASSRYLGGYASKRIASDIDLCFSLVESPASAVKVAVGDGPADGTFVLTVAARQERGVLARLAGAAALAGFDILDVDADSGPSGLTLDRFTVASATGRPLNTSSFSAFERFAASALADRLELAVRLRERRRHYPPVVASPVNVESAADATGARIEVSAPNRPGLLYDIAWAVSDTGLDIAWAKARTIAGVAHDVFAVSRSDGCEVADGQLGHVAMRIREALTD